MATKEELKSKLGQLLEQRRAERAEALAPVQAQIEQIKELIAAGDTRQAYRVFEELPILDQLAISLTPGVGDALAVFETGEFGARAGERFEQDDTLGGLGNVALSGLAGLSLLPIVGPVAGVAGKAARGLTRAAKVDPDMPAGGAGGYVIPNEYTGTKAAPSAPGLISPNRAALVEMDNKPMKLESLVAQLRKKVPNKEGELRMLGLLDENNDITPVARKYFAGQQKITPQALDQYLSFSQRPALNVVRPARSDYESPGYDDIDKNTEVQRIYEVEGVNTSLARNKHFSDQGYTKDIAFDSTDGSDGIMRVGRIQSDYDQMLKKQAEKAKNSILYKDADAVTRQKEINAINPFRLPDKITELPSFSSDKEGVAKLRKLMEEFNANVEKRNRIMNERLAPLYGSGMRPTTDYQRLPNIRPNEVKAQAKELDRKNLTLRGQMGELIDDMEEGLFENSEYIGSDIRRGYKDLVRTLAIDKLPRAARLIAEREINYDRDSLVATPRDADQFDIPSSVDLDPQYYRFTNSKLDLDLMPSFDIDESIKKLDEMKQSVSDIDIEANRFFNLNKPKLDPYATAGGKKTKSYVFPVRNLMNEALHNDATDILRFQSRAPLEREGGRASPVLMAHYDNALKEAEKVVKEIVGSDTDLPYVTKGEEYLDVNMDAIRDYLVKTGKDGKISAFKSGGSVDIDSLLNNL